jgi:outer membrane biosynthesis protein TonB
MYSVVFHVCIATSFVLVKTLNISFRKPLHEIAYSVDLVEMNRSGRKGGSPALKQPQKKEEPQAKLKPEPKPDPKPKQEPKPAPKPEPKPEHKAVVEKKPAPMQERKVEVPKAAQPRAAKEETPQVKTAPEPVKAEPPPPAPADPGPADLARAAAPEPAAAAGSTVDLDTENITPELKWYIEMIRRKVWQNWIEPSHALTPGTHARVVIRFEIGRDGKFASEPMVFESSSNLALDQSGFRAVLRSVPFPPLPESYSGSSLGVRFGFEYGERV